MKNKKNLLSIIVPCYNEEESIPLFYKEVKKIIKKTNLNYQLIFVNDGSKDKTLEKLKELSKLDKNIIYLSFSRNFGKESAMLAGLKNADGDYTVIMDADLQHPPFLLLEMLERIQTKEYDCIACRRIDRKGDSKVRTWFARSFYRIINKVSDTEMMDGAGDYRMMTRKMVNAILSISEYNRFSKGIFSWVGFKTYWISYENVDRVAGTTSWSFSGLVKYAIDGVINFSSFPLDIASWAGLITTLAAFIYLIVIIIKYAIVGDPVQGWATTICVILILGGIQLFSLGVMGQYIGKTYLETKNRPNYIIDESNKKEIN